MRVLASTGAYTTQSASDRADLVEVAGRRDTEGLEPAELPDVSTDLVGAVHPCTDQLELGVRDHPLDRFLADEAGRPLDHAVRHDLPFPSAHWCRRAL